MNRSNVGNVVTNGMQILSVGATTAAGMLGHADSALNNLSSEERRKLTEVRANKLRDEISEYENKDIDNIMQNDNVDYVKNSDQIEHIITKQNRVRDWFDKFLERKGDVE